MFLVTLEPRNSTLSAVQKSIVITLIIAVIQGPIYLVTETWNTMDTYVTVNRRSV